MDKRKQKGVRLTAKGLPDRRGLRIHLTSERNLRIIERIDSGETAAAIAKDEGITRERVRQIYLRTTGVAAGKVSLGFARQRRAIKQAVIDEQKRETISFYCSICGNPVNSLIRKTSSKYCQSCREFLKKTGLDLTNKRICYQCGDICFKYRTNKYDKRRSSLSKDFCSMRCYIIWMKKNGPPVQKRWNKNAG